MGKTTKRCYDCGNLGDHYPWCGVKHLDEDRAVKSVPMFKFVPPAEDKPVWQKPSLAGSYDVISSPAHYARFAIQPIDFIEANGLDFLQASVLKYLVRFPFKNGVEDLHKARDMLNRLIKREEKKAERQVGMVPELGMGYTGGAEPEPGDIYWKLVGNAGQEVGGQPATGNAESRGNTGDGSQ